MGSNTDSVELSTLSHYLLELSKPLQKHVFWCGAREPGKLPECIATSQGTDGGGSWGPVLRPGVPQRCFTPAGVSSLGRKRVDLCAPQPTQRGQFPRLLAPPSPSPCLLHSGQALSPNLSFVRQNQAVLCPFPLGLWKLMNRIDPFSERCTRMGF